MKKKIAAIMAMILAAGTLSGCGSSDKETTNGVPANEQGLNIVTTIFPEYDWVMNILGEKADLSTVTLLMDAGVDLHSYQSTAEDILQISTCDVFVYVGGESDGWVEDALKEAVNDEMVVINLMDALGDSVKEEQVVEGMQEDEEEDEEEPENDEHVWLSLKNADRLCGVIAEALEQADPDNAEVYKKNAAEYRKKLQALDLEYEAAVAEGAVDTILFGDRFPFLYMAEDYGLNYFAAFAGCSAETEASFETITFLAQKVDELGLPAVLTIENSDQKIAQTIVENTKSQDAKILQMDSMQSTTAKAINDGKNYLNSMEKNLEVLKEALG